MVALVVERTSFHEHISGCKQSAFGDHSTFGCERREHFSLMMCDSLMCYVHDEFVVVFFYKIPTLVNVAQNVFCLTANSAV